MPVVATPGISGGHEFKCDCAKRRTLALLTGDGKLSIVNRGLRIDLDGYLPFTAVCPDCSRVWRVDARQRMMKTTLLARSAEYAVR